MRERCLCASGERWHVLNVELRTTPPSPPPRARTSFLLFHPHTVPKVYRVQSKRVRHTPLLTHPGASTGLGCDNLEGQRLWVHHSRFPFFVANHHHESPFQKQTQEITRSSPAKCLLGNPSLHPRLASYQPNHWLWRWAGTKDRRVDQADMTVSSDGMSHGRSQVVFRDRMDEDRQLVSVTGTSGAAISGAEQRDNRKGDFQSL